MRSLAVVFLVAFVMASPAHAERPRSVYVPAKLDPTRFVGAVVNSKTIFFNRCKANCQVLTGTTDSRTNKSSIGAGTLTAFEHGDAAWSAVMACLTDTFKRFNVKVTDVDPGRNVEHFEVMVAGSPGQIGLPSYVGGIAEYSCYSPGQCDKYLPNALVFAFANIYDNDPDEICATAAQEIAHTWSLDHASDPSDPMTYYDYTGRRQFKDGVLCGSDCQNGQSPFGLACSPQGNHTCMSTGQSTQDDVGILLALFGPAGAVNPTLTVKTPTIGSAVSSGFTVEAECTASGATIQEVQFSIDGVLKQVLTAPPFNFASPATLADGPHRLTVLCATTQQAITTKQIDVIKGPPCSEDSECANGFICFGACIAGPGTAGGLGAVCMGDQDCLAGACASDGEISACTIPCDLSNKHCPAGFGCLEAGADSGVCWAGYDDGGGCCETGRSDPRGSMLLSLALAALWITRRRPRNRR